MLRVIFIIIVVCALVGISFIDWPSTKAFIQQLLINAFK